MCIRTSKTSETADITQTDRQTERQTTKERERNRKRGGEGQR